MDTGGNVRKLILPSRKGLEVINVSLLMLQDIFPFGNFAERTLKEGVEIIFTEKSQTVKRTEKVPIILTLHNLAALERVLYRL